jgi:inosine-uridine nucleoside N-ribohydrolase
MRHFAFLLFLLTTPLLYAQSPKKVIIDADTGNEVDDLYAVVRALIEPSWEVTALNATQWQASHWTVEESMEESYRLNQVLLGELGMSGKLRSYRGATDRLFDWGYLAQHSAATYYLIQEAKQHTAADKLIVIALGALTNVASAILIEPSIQDKIELYWLGTTYDFENNVLRKRDFNCMMDQQALAEILDSEVETHIIPVSVANQMTFNYEESLQKMPIHNTLNRFLLERWYHHLDGGRKERVIWDLAIVAAVIHPEWATQQSIQTSPENGGRQVWYYSDIDENAMRKDFFEVLAKHLSQR